MATRVARAPGGELLSGLAWLCLEETGLGQKDGQEQSPKQQPQADWELHLTGLSSRVEGQAGRWPTRRLA